MAKKNLYSIKEALLYPKHVQELVVFLKEENDPYLLQQIDKFENLATLSLLDSKSFRTIPKEVFKLKKLVQLKLRATAVTEIPNDLEFLTSLEELIIEDCPIKQLPDNLGKLAALKKINIVKSGLTKLPDSIFQLKNLKALDISYSKISELPEQIGTITSLEELNINYSLIQTVPSSLLKIDSLKKLNLAFNKISSLPNGLHPLHRLIYIDLRYNNLKELPFTDWKVMQNLTYIYLANNQIEKIPLGIEDAPKLECLDIEENQLTSVPDLILKSTTLNTLHLEQNPFKEFPAPLLEWYVEKRSTLFHQGFFINQELTFKGLRDLLQNHTFKKLNRADKIAFYKIHSQDPKAIASLSLETLYFALNSVAPNIATFALAYLTEKNVEPIKKGNKILILGKTITPLKEIEERLINCGLELTSKIEEANHILISARANKKVKKWPSTITWQWISEAQLNAFFDAVDPTYLVEATTSDTNNVADLILSLKEENMALGLSIIEGGGLPESLFTEAFIVYKMSEDAELRKKAFELLKAKASPELMTVIKNRSVLNKKGYLFDKDKRKIVQLIQEYTQNTILDIGKLAYAVFMKTKCGLSLALQDNNLTRRKEVLFSLVENNEFSLYYTEPLDTFPMEILDYVGLKKLSFHVSKGEWKNGQYIQNPNFYLPEEISKLQDLEELSISWFEFDTLPLESLATLKKLNYFRVAITSNVDREQLKTMLTHCTTIIIN